MLNNLKLKVLATDLQLFIKSNEEELVRVSEALVEGFTFGQDSDEYILKKKQKKMKTDITRQE
mgnify:CR=1 FL=1